MTRIGTDESDIAIDMPTRNSVHVAVVRKFVRDIAGRGRDQTTIAHLTPDETREVWSLIDRAAAREAVEVKRLELARLEKRAAELRDELGVES